MSLARLLALAALALAVTLPGCSQPVEVGDASSADQPADPDNPASADAEEPVATDPGTEEIDSELGTEQIDTPAPTPLSADDPLPGAPAESPETTRAPAPSGSGLVASPDNLDDFFGNSTPAAADDRYTADAAPPIPGQPSDEPALWKRDAADDAPDERVSEFFGDMMDEPPPADSAPAPAEQNPLAGLPMAEEEPAPSADDAGNSQDALGGFLSQPETEPETAEETPPEQPPSAETPSVEPPGSGFPFFDEPTEPAPQPEPDNSDVLPPLDFPPLAEPPAEPAAEPLEPAAENPSDPDPGDTPADTGLSDWSPVRPTDEPQTPVADDEPPAAPAPTPEPPSTPPMELPAPTLPLEPGDPIPPPAEERRPPPKRPTPHMNNTRQLAWLLGAKLGMTTAGESAPKAWELEGLAETLGIEPVAIDARGDAAQSTARLLKASGTLGKRLARQHGSDHAALLEIAVKSNALASLIADHPKLAEPVAKAIEQAAARSELDPELMKPLVKTLRANPSPQEAREAVFQLHEAVVAELESEG
ncbi:hypothetical protein [Posidoniimonas polymericola]|uniref:hypothetical protein n=1 Tax=Posidoniimonas polymericola TaxID=2528002 RepID=UPI0011B824BB|nr:hypothetical protein [Posidoniimonas polymericola]